jgi:hypothetical protein
VKKYEFVVFTSPASEEVEQEYNDWYDNVHLRDVLDVPGFVSAARYEWEPRDDTDEKPQHKYLALYQIETDDLNATMRALSARSNTPALVISPALGKDVWAKAYRRR